MPYKANDNLDRVKRNKQNIANITALHYRRKQDVSVSLCDC